MGSIKIIDLIMGGGKSTYSHSQMYQHREKRYIYITPYLDEIERLIGTEQHRTKFYLQRNFREPIQLGEGKLDSLHQLLIDEYNIVTTHALFKKATTETIELIASGEYTLVLDEALNVTDMIDIGLKDYNMLINNELIKVDEKGVVKWLDAEYEGKFSSFKNQCRNGTVIQIKKTQKIQFLAWNFSAENFNAFKEVIIFTYLFDASYMKYYFDMCKISYEHLSLEDGQLIPCSSKRYDKAKLKKLINIYEGNLNLIGNKKNALSLNWFKNFPDLRSKVKNNIYNYFRNVVSAKSDSIIWTTFKSNKNHLAGGGYAKRFIPCNTRATNEYMDCTNLAYCCNRFMSPDYIEYFNSHGVLIDNDLYALSELLQWMWRSAIRQGKLINIYIPSARMRELLVDWLNNESI